MHHFFHNQESFNHIVTFTYSKEKNNTEVYGFTRFFCGKRLAASAEA